MDNLNSNIAPLTVNGTISTGTIQGNLNNNSQINISGLGIPSKVQQKVVISHTTEYWAQNPTVSQKDVIYVFTDHQQLDGEDIPGIKIGDGNAYVMDLPFCDDVYSRHIADRILHITQEERNFWNNKVTCYIDPFQADRIVFSKN